MGTWDAGHFDNDTAADFAYALDKTPAEEKADLVRGTLMRSITTNGYLHCDEGAEAVAAAALVAAQLPGGDPVTSDYGPKQTVPDLPVELARQEEIRRLGRAGTRSPGLPHTDAAGRQPLHGACIHGLTDVVVWSAMEGVGGE